MITCKLTLDNQEHEKQFQSLFDWSEWFKLFKGIKAHVWTVESETEYFKTHKRISVERFVLSETMELLETKDCYFEIRIEKKQLIK